MSAPSHFPKIVAKGRKLAPYEDAYHWVLALSWPAFFVCTTAVFFSTNALFGLAYWLLPSSVANASGFLDCFFFSVETLATIGYGEMTPVGLPAHAIMSVEALLGILFTAVITGLTFARFAKPRARILFSKNILINQRDGKPTLTFRLANWRRNQILEANLDVVLLIGETTKEGEPIRRPVPLKLLRSRSPMFAMSWSVFHVIDESSPFFGDDALERLRTAGAEIFVWLHGLDETVMDTVTARWRYTLDDIVVGKRFADVIELREDGVRVIDYGKFHDLLAADETKP